MCAKEEYSRRSRRSFWDRVYASASHCVSPAANVGLQTGQPKRQVPKRPRKQQQQNQRVWRGNMRNQGSVTLLRSLRFHVYVECTCRGSGRGLRPAPLRGPNRQVQAGLRSADALLRSECVSIEKSRIAQSAPTKYDFDRHSYRDTAAGRRGRSGSPFLYCRLWSFRIHAAAPDARVPLAADDTARDVVSHSVARAIQHRSTAEHR